MMKKKTDENYRNCYVFDKCLVSKLSIKIYPSHILIVQILDFNYDDVNISHPYLLYFPRNKLSKSVTVWPGHAGLVHNFKLFK